MHISFFFFATFRAYFYYCVFSFFQWWSIYCRGHRGRRNSIGTGFPKILTVTSIKIEINIARLSRIFTL